jgi:creatinine amidohydrolase
MTSDANSPQLTTRPDRRLFGELSWPEVNAAIARNAGVILPIGATEQHGPHLPLNTDVVLPTELALAVAEPLDLLVAPPIVYGSRSRPLSGGGQGFVGTTSLRGTTLIALVTDVVSEWLRHGFRRLAILNWHWENRNFVYEAAYEALDARRYPDAQIAVMEVPFGQLSPATMSTLYPDGFPGWETEHASIMETSLMLHLRPDLVQEEFLIDDEALRTPWYDVIPTPDDFVPTSGVLWKATQATREKGELAWREIVDGVSQGLMRDLPQLAQ